MQKEELTITLHHYRFLVNFDYQKGEKTYDYYDPETLIINSIECVNAIIGIDEICDDYYRGNIEDFYEDVKEEIRRQLW